MRAISKRVALTIVILYGVFIFVVVAPMYLFSFQQSQPLIIRLAGGVYTLTLLPAALAGIRWGKFSGSWMIGVAVISVLALWVNEISRYRATDGLISLIVSLLWWAILAAVPGVLGMIFQFSRKR